jgi:dihydroorotate dehydrogenase electron transfer subunit
VKPVPVEVIHNQAVTPVIYRMGLKPLEPLAHAVAGQFYMVRTSPGLDPLLRRPLGHFGYCRAHDGVTSPAVPGTALEILYQVKGRGTELLTHLEPGHATDLIGPLGRGWLPTPEAERLILVAGGIGIVPLRSLADQLRARGDRRPITLIWGVKSATEMCCREDLAVLDLEHLPASEDGGLGHPGLATDLLEPTLEAAAEKKLAVFACGPWAMLKKIAALASRRHLPCQVSLDAYMACGLGACLSCVVRARDGHHLRVCKEGPVFRAEEIDWNTR